MGTTYLTTQIPQTQNFEKLIGAANISESIHSHTSRFIQLFVGNAKTGAAAGAYGKARETAGK